MILISQEILRRKRCSSERETHRYVHSFQILRYTVQERHKKRFVGQNDGCFYCIVNVYDALFHPLYKNLTSHFRLSGT